MLEVIYVVRHGYRSNWTVDPQTGSYSSHVRTPTGIPADPALASYGVRQSHQLATHLHTLNPQPTKVYSSPFYRCIQTIAPYVESRPKYDQTIWLEQGLAEFFGCARFDHPQPASLEVLSEHFPGLLKQESDSPIIVPYVKGESIEMLHNRTAYVLHHLIRKLDADPNGPKSVLLCTHAAVIIAMGRVLTGRMPGEVGEEDFRCFTAGVSTYRRKGAGDEEGVGKVWDASRPEVVPDVGWRDGKGVQGGWVCEGDSDCSFLDGGEERGWNFHMEDERIKRLEAEDAEKADGHVSTTTTVTDADASDENGIATS